MFVTLRCARSWRRFWRSCHRRSGSSSPTKGGHFDLDLDLDLDHVNSGDDDDHLDPKVLCLWPSGRPSIDGKQGNF